MSAAPAYGQAGPVVTGPPEGSLVGSRPQFTLGGDLTAVMFATVEVSEDPALLTAGEDPGAFLSRFEWSVWSVPEDAPANVLTWDQDRPLPAGEYFWHARLNSGADPAVYLQPGISWGPVGTFAVNDEPALVEGWVVRARRLSTRQRCARVQVTATVAFSDNDPDPSVALTVTLKQGSRVVLRLREKKATFSPYRLTGVACTRAKALAARLGGPGR